MINEKIIIMDFATCEVHIFPYDSTKWGEDGESFLYEHCTEQGLKFKPGQCDWMIVDINRTEERLPIYIH